MKPEDRDSILAVIGVIALLTFVTFAPGWFHWATLKVANVLAREIHRP
jgi:hypothetical protein